MVKELVLVRIILMLMIFVHHINTAYNGGYSAVAAFFVLSGFVLTLGYHSKVSLHDFSYSRYLKKRLIRLYPVHWVCLLLFLLLFFVLEKNSEMSYRALAMNCMLLQSWVPSMDVYFSFNSPSWYCSSLLMFVVFFPLFMKFIADIPFRKQIVFFSILLGIYIMLWIVFPDAWRHSVLYINPVMRLFDCLLGVGTALFVLHLDRNKNIMDICRNHYKLLQVASILALIILVLLSLYLPGKWKSFSILYWLPTIVVLVSLTILNHVQKLNMLSSILTSSPMQLIGQCSFSFFMIHALVIRFGRVYVLSVFPYGHNICIQALVLFIISFLLAQALYYFIEIKLIKLLIKT